MGCKTVGPVCCIMLVKEPIALIEKRRGLPPCSWFDWQNICATAPCKPLHIVGLHVLKEKVSYIKNVAPQYFLENTEC